MVNAHGSVHNKSKMWNRELFNNYKTHFKNNLTCLSKADPPISPDSLSTWQKVQSCVYLYYTGFQPKSFNKLIGEVSSFYIERYYKKLLWESQLYTFFDILKFNISYKVLSEISVNIFFILLAQPHFPLPKISNCFKFSWYCVLFVFLKTTVSLTSI